MKSSIYTDGSYALKHPEMHVPDSKWKGMHIVNILKKNKIYPKKICEIGCGAGEVIKTVHENCETITESIGYEISPEAFDMCKTRAGNGLKFYLKDFFEEKEPVFDLLLCIDVFEHVDDYLGFIKLMKNRSRYKIFHIPLDLSAHTILRETPIIRSREKNGHLHYYNKYTAIESLRYSGYEILDYHYTLTSIERGSGTFLNNLGKIPRKILYKINPDLCVKLLGGFSLIVLAK